MFHFNSARVDKETALKYAKRNEKFVHGLSPYDFIFEIDQLLNSNRVKNIEICFLSYNFKELIAHLFSEIMDFWNIKNLDDHFLFYFGSSVEQFFRN